MKVNIGNFNFSVCRGITIKKFYWIPKRITLYSNPVIYRWGYWNYDFLKNEDRNYNNPFLHNFKVKLRFDGNSILKDIIIFINDCHSKYDVKDIINKHYPNSVIVSIEQMRR